MIPRCELSPEAIGTSTGLGGLGFRCLRFRV